MAVKLLMPMTDGEVSLLPFTDEFVEPLRLACGKDTRIWEIYPLCFFGDKFDRSLQIISSSKDRLCFAVFNAGECVGMTSYINADLQTGTVEIGGTYIAPEVRGTGFNRTMKALLIEHAFACGFRTVAFKVDTRNGRSMAAVEKLGARHVGTLDKNMTTWTGFVRDTAVFHLTPEDWQDASRPDG